MSVNNFKIKCCELESQGTTITLSGGTIAELIATLICRQAENADDSRDTIDLYKNAEKYLREAIEYCEIMSQKGNS